MSSIEENLRQVLPALEAEKIKDVLQRLEELGASDIEDLKLVEENDFKGVIKPIQARKLINAWKNTEPPKILQDEWVPMPCTSEGASKVSVPNIPTVVDSEWASKFSVPWSKMPSELLDALKEKKRPEPLLRLHMVRVICEKVREVSKNPGSNALTIIAQNITKTYPNSFSDIVGDEVVASGCASLAKQLRNRFQNLNRGNTLNLLKRKKKNEDETCNSKKICNADQYGCVNWQPDRLPESETPLSQEEKRDTMKRLFKQGPLVYNASDFLDLLNSTYFTQRREINTKKTVEFLMSEWPLLFTTEGFLQHFNNLVGINIVEKFQNAITKKAHRVTEFIETKPAGASKKDIENVIKEANLLEDLRNGTEFVLFLLMAYFGEKRDSLFICADNSTTPQEVKNIKDLPSTPCLIICGETEYSGTSYMLCVDTIVVNDEIKDFESGILMLFASFYCLNVEYPHTAASTLEFIQRCFLNINPDSGTKVSKAVKKKHQVFNAKVLTLLKGVADYEWVSK